MAAASVGVTEGGAAGSVCVVLTGTTGSPTELVNALAVSLASVLNAEAGRLTIINSAFFFPTYRTWVHTTNHLCVIM